MSTTCLINNYNYARYVGDAVDSALSQSVPLDEIIVVDDGSQDGSLELLRSRYAKHPAVRIIDKQHQGQLSCFNEGFASAKGDIVFFLDADDIYQPDYVEKTLAVYDRNPFFDCVFCGCHHFGLRDGVHLKSAKDRDLGYSVIRVAYLRDWIGASTSCLSMRRSVLEKILPFPFTEDWRIRADDCLVFGSSLAGARKYYLAQPLVRRRVHEGNRFLGCTSESVATYRRRLAINSMFAYLERKYCYDVPRLADFHHHEFRTIARPTFRDFTKYLRLTKASQSSIFRRLACVTDMLRHYLRSSFGFAQTAESSSTFAFGDRELMPLRLFDPADTRAGAAAQKSQEGQRQAA